MEVDSSEKMNETQPDCSVKRKIGADLVLSHNEVLEFQQLLTENANAVLGASDEKNCSYPKGYVKRQALYSCLTCIPESKLEISKCAGVCLACCINCHEGHDLVELYTKRNFRCDCGNSKFPDFKCLLESAKSAFNVLNVYDQNFSGLYCVCNRPYPDEEDKIVDTMLQCIICEDWFHTRHLGVEVPFNTYAEMTCESCIKKHDFLLYYDHLSVTKDKEEKDCVSNDVISELTNENEKDDVENKQTEERTIDCKMPKIKSKTVCTKFWEDVTWRQQLCNCENCLKMYEDQKISFITDLQDTVHEYEEIGKNNVIEKELDEKDDTNSILNDLEEIHFSDSISEYDYIKGCLDKFIQKYKENKKVIKCEDIKNFFQRIKSKKKIKLN